MIPFPEKPEELSDEEALKQVLHYEAETDRLLAFGKMTQWKA